MKLNPISLALCTLFLSPLSHASDYPIEFADFFEEQLKQVEVAISGMQGSSYVSGYVSVENFRLESSEEEKSKLAEFLLERKIEPEWVELIVATLNKGVEANPGCEGEISYCIPSTEHSGVAFTFDYDSNVLRIFVSSQVLASGLGEVRYYSGLREDNALINTSRFYGSVHKESSSASLNNDTLLGVPYGYIESSHQLSTQEDNEFDLYSLNYNVEFGQTRIKAGYQSNVAYDEFNSTDALRYGSDFAGSSISVGTSRNLMLGSEKSMQRVYFFAPQTATLEVYRGDRILLNKTVEQGENSIGYDEIPAGVYDIRIVVRRGESLLVDETRAIVNTNQYELVVGGMDYRLTFGELESADKGNYYAYGASSYRATEALLTGAGIAGDGDAVMFQANAIYMLSDNSSLNLLASGFSADAYYLQSQLRIGPALIYGKQFESQSIENSFANDIYGEDNFYEVGLSISQRVLGGDAYFNYSKTHYTNPVTSDKNDQASDSFSLTWTRPLWGGDLSVNGSYSASGDHDQLYAMVGWRHDLGHDGSLSTSTSFDKGGLTQSNVTATKQFEGDDWYASGSIGAYTDSVGSDVESTLTANGSNEYIDYNGYAYGSTDGQYSFTGSVENTQIISSKTSYFTADQSESYLHIEPKYESRNNDKKIYFNLVKDDQIWLNNKMNAAGDELIKLPNYIQLGVTLDAELENLVIEDSSKVYFTQPGTVYSVQPDLQAIESQVILLNDMFGKPIQHASCIGEGCKSVEPISEDGVFRLNYIPGKPFKVVSRKRLCVYDTEQFGNNFVNSYCLEGLDNSGLEDSLVFSSDDEAINISKVDAQGYDFLGRYQSSDEAKLILERLKEVKLIALHVQVGDDLYVYVKHPSEYSVAQSTLLESLEKFAKYDSINQEQQFGIAK